MKLLPRAARIASRAMPMRKANLAPIATIAIWAIAAMLASIPASAGTPATTANDICASNADPCNVTRAYDVTANAVLDFGTRSVNVSGAGSFDFGTGSGEIACGNFTASTTGTFLTAAGPRSGGGTRSGSVLLKARRRCAAASPAVPCLDGSDCNLGTCGVRRCSKRSTQTCLADGDCQLGTCGPLRRCTGSARLVACSTNADCDYGSCPAQLSCTGRGDNPMNCATNGDCSFGTCSVGTGSITIDGGIAGSSDSPATLLLRAADSVSISKPVTLNGTSLDSDGGILSVDSRAGSITVTGKITATGGGDSQGGSVEFTAASDIAVHEDISLLGGDFDGGTIDFTAGRDVTIDSDLIASSNSGAGYGGDITVSAGRDLSFSGLSPSNKSTMEASGHTDIEGYAGDGGSVDLTAGRNASLDANSRLVGNGSIPDGSGADLSLRSGADLVMNGAVVAKSVGNEGSGGFVQLTTTGGAASIGSTATFDVTGGSGGGGTFKLDASSGDLGFDGDCDVSGGLGGAGGSARLSARQTASVAGTLFLSAGSGPGELYVDACRLTLAGGGNLDNRGAGGHNTLVSHDILQLLTGSTMATDAGGSNTLRYRSASRPPLVQGTVTPAPALVVDPTLTSCPLCGNRVIDAGESCDDGNATGGDGCSAACQNENCVAQTISPGFPTVALCEDGNPCTTDVCNASLGGGTCQHPAKNCDDAIACTLDTCDAGDGTCRHSVTDAMCNDGNVCTDDFCSATTGCSNTANSSPCDDRNRCTANDVCSAKACHGTRITGCLFCGDEFVNHLGGEQCDDGNVADGDCCSSTCKFETAGAACEDGKFCTIGDLCDGAGACVTGPPNTCADTDACTADSCDEETASCVNARVPRDAGTCLVAPSARLQIRNPAKEGADKLSWQWAKGEAFFPEDVGAPAASTAYTLCIYDSTAGIPSLKASIDIAPSATLWQAADPAIVQYKDKAGTSEGVQRAELRSGETGKTRIRIGAGGTGLVLPTPEGATFFRQDPSLVVQLVNSDGMCWTSRFTPDNTKKNAATLFNAATK